MRWKASPGASRDPYATGHLSPGATCLVGRAKHKHKHCLSSTVHEAESLDSRPLHSRKTPGVAGMSGNVAHKGALMQALEGDT